MQNVYKVFKDDNTKAVVILLDKDGKGIEVRSDFRGGIYGVVVNEGETVVIVPKTFI